MKADSLYILLCHYANEALSQSIFNNMMDFSFRQKLLVNIMITGNCYDIGKVGKVQCKCNTVLMFYWVSLIPRRIHEPKRVYTGTWGVCGALDWACRLVLTVGWGCPVELRVAWGCGATRIVLEDTCSDPPKEWRHTMIKYKDIT